MSSNEKLLMDGSKALALASSGRSDPRATYDSHPIARSVPNPYPSSDR